MIMAKKLTKICAFILLVLMILYFCLAAIHLTSDCTHEDDCPICAIINKFREELTGCNPSLVVLVVFLVFLLFDLCHANTITDKKRTTPVGLKVELIN